MSMACRNSAASNEVRSNVRHTAVIGFTLIIHLYSRIIYNFVLILACRINKAEIVHFHEIT